MEPAIRKRAFNCPEWQELARKRKVVIAAAIAAGRGKGPFGLNVTVRGVSVRVEAQVTHLHYPPRVTYYIQGIRLPPKLFAEYLNDILNAPEGWVWEPQN